MTERLALATAVELVPQVLDREVTLENAPAGKCNNVDRMFAA